MTARLRELAGKLRARATRLNAEPSESTFYSTADDTAELLTEAAIVLDELDASKAALATPSTGAVGIGRLIAVARPEDLEEKDWKGWDLAIQAMIRAQREASREAVGNESGALVPLEPSERMLYEGYWAAEGSSYHDLTAAEFQARVGDGTIRDAYRAMIAAAPRDTP